MGSPYLAVILQVRFGACFPSWDYQLSFPGLRGLRSLRLRGLVGGRQHWLCLVLTLCLLVHLFLDEAVAWWYFFLHYVYSARGTLNVRNSFTLKLATLPFTAVVFLQGNPAGKYNGWRSSRGIPSGFGYYHGAAYAILARTPGLFIPVVLAHVA